MKKIFPILVIAIVLYTCILVLASCGENEPPHAHNYSTLKFDEKKHWFECECGDKKNIQNHITGAEATETTGQKCTLCEYVITPALGHIHTLHLTKVDANVQSCTEEGNIEYYTCDCGKWFTNNTATTEIIDKSSVVIGKDPHTHTILKHSETQHWYECVCSDTSDIESHKGGVATCTELAECSVCQVEYGMLTAHKYSTDWVITDTHHYQESTCGCDVKKDYGEHTPDNSGFCSLCELAMCATEGLIIDVSIDGTYAEVLGYSGKSTKVNIPSSYNNLPVKAIYREAFVNNKNIVTLVIPDSVISIGASAFYGCSSLEGIEIPESVTFIGNDAFYSCSSLKSIVIPNGVKSIGPNAFQYCTSLKSVILGDGLERIEIDAFFGCSSLENLIIGCKVKSIDSYAIRGCSKLKSITIPDSVTNIGYYAFSGCTSLENISFEEGSKLQDISAYAFENCHSSLYLIENNIQYKKANNNPYYFLSNVTNKNLSAYSINETTKIIMSEAFYRCERLVNITIPNGITTICGAFADCYSLTSIEIPNGVTSIGNQTFDGCESLVNINIPDGVEIIGDYAFRNCTSLATINIPDNVISIGEYAFYNCASLATINIPDSVIYIGNYAFVGCYSFTYNTKDNLKYLGNTTNPYLYLVGVVSNYITSASIDNNCKFIGDSAFAKCTSLTKIEIPNSIISIGARAFYFCISIESIELPDSVIHIGYGAFNECRSLKYVVLGNGVEKIEDHLFSYCDSLVSLTFNDTSTWYRMQIYVGTDRQNWQNKTGGEITNVTNPSANVVYFKSTYSGYYWYKL